MNYNIPIYFFLVLMLSCTYNNSKDNKSNLVGDTTAITSELNDNMNNPYPFELRDNGGQHFVIVAEIEGEQLYPKYANFFEQYGYSGNGYCWEGHIIQILEKIAPELLQHIDFDPEAGAFYAYADSKESQMKFVALLSPIFTDLVKLEKFVKEADSSRIDD